MKAIIIDDEAVALAAMQRRIRWEKYGIDEVFTAQSMRQAIKLMEENAVDLMLCDVEMPGGSGLELYEWVRTYCPDTECVFVSCHPEYEYVRKALTMGSMDYVLKPVDYEEMDRILQEAAKRIRNRHARAAGAERSSLPSPSGSYQPQSDNYPLPGGSYQPQSDNHQSPGSSYRPLISNYPPQGSSHQSQLTGNADSIPEAAGRGSAIPGAAGSQAAVPIAAGRGSAPVSEKLLSDSIREAVHYIREHLGTNMSIGEIAAFVHLNPQYFMRLFKKETGKSVLEYITDCRLASARQMLEETSLPITEVALAAGYDNFSYFSKLFRRNEGMSPSEYRKNKR